MHIQLTEFLELNNIFYSGQFGFRKKHSTTLALQHLVNKILTEHEMGNIVGVLCIDLSKAFDTICHKMLLGKLQHMGIRGQANELICSYLSNRKMCVKINGSKGKYISSERDIGTGCPQGSLLGPLFFSCIINDLYLQLSQSECLCYADDTTIICTGKNSRELKLKLEHDINILEAWFRFTKLSLNASKTQFQIFNIGWKKIDNTDIKVANINIMPMAVVKFLGVLLDNKLTWKHHGDYVLNKLKSARFMLNSVKKFMTVDVRKIFYYAHFYSHLQYGISIWGPMLSKDMEKQLYISQKKNLRVITDSKYNAHTDPIFKSLHILKLKDLIKLEICKYAYKMNYNLLPRVMYRPYIGQYKTSSHNTRQSNMPKIPKHKSSKFNNSIICQSVTEWSKLSANLRQKNNIYTFSKNLKKQLISPAVSL